jgi:hypothetical protein
MTSFTLRPFYSQKKSPVRIEEQKRWAEDPNGRDDKNKSGLRVEQGYGIILFLFSAYFETMANCKSQEERSVVHNIRLFVGPSCRWEYRIKMDFKEKCGRVKVKLIPLSTGTIF